MKKRNEILLALFVSVAHSFPVLASVEKGVEEFKKKNYSLALNELQTHLKSHPKDINAIYYAGMSCQLSGKNSEALKYYRKICELAPNSQTAKQLRPYLSSYDTTYGSLASFSSDPFEATQQAKKRPFKDRIVIVRPKFGHPPVSSQTIAAAQNVIRSLPRHIYNMLDKNGVTINLAPNIIDKWPGSGDEVKPMDPSSTLGEEPGRTYDFDVHVYEREMVRGSTKLKEARNSFEIASCLLHEIGHTLDGCSGMSSQKAEFMQAHKLDAAQIPVGAIQPYYINNASEAFAEITASLLGATDSTAIAAGKYFPRSKILIKSKLGL